MVKRVYRTMQGKEIDMEALQNQHEMMPAVGNAKVNARGDELGAGGKVVRSRENIMAEYYENNPNAIPQTGTKKIKAKKEDVQEEMQEKPVQEKPVQKTQSTKSRGNNEHS